MSKSTIKLLIALGALAGVIYMLNKTAENVKQMIDKKSVPQTSQLIDIKVTADKIPQFPQLYYKSPVILS